MNTNNSAILSKLSLFIPTILLMAPITGAGIDIYAPSLPAIKHVFFTSSELVKLTVTVYLISYGLSLLIYGTLSDVFGRKKVLIVSLLGFILISITIPFSMNIYMLLGLRCLQGFFVAGSSVISKSILVDVCDEQDLVIKSNYINIAWGMGPIVSPVIGGYLQHYFGWHASFYFLAIYAAMVLSLTIVFIPETLGVERRHRLNVSNIVHNYKTLFGSKVFVATAGILALAYAMMTIFNVMGPFLIQKGLSYTPVAYGHFALMLGAGWVLGSFAARLLMKQYTNTQLFKFSINVLILVSLVMLLGVLLFGTTIALIILPTFLLLFFASLIYPGGMAKCLSVSRSSAGSASALMGSFYIVGAGLASGLASLLQSLSALALAICYVLLAIACAVIFYGKLKSSFD